METRTRDVDIAPRLILPPENTFENRGDGSNEMLDERMRAARTGLPFSFERLCTVKYDGFTLPIFWNQHGTIVFATQNGTPPDLNALMGDQTDVTNERSVVIQRLDAAGDAEVIARHDESLLLGRNANSRGVLVEKPEADGSRSIGLASWSEDSVTWLVDDGAVNAFGWISETGRLIYSSRKQGDEEFTLKIREKDGRTWTIPETLPYSWVLPTWSHDGEGIFAIRMGDGYGDLAWGRSNDAGVFRRSLMTRRISDRFSMGLAWQTLASTTGGTGVSDTRIAWYSFENWELSLWNGERDAMQPLQDSALACCELEEDFEWLLTTREGLDLIRIEEDAVQVSPLLSGPWICRKTTGDTSILVKAYENTLQIGRITFGVEPLPHRVERDVPKPAPDYEYNIRD
ncbi:MAG TPA: hypothetical protein DCX60_06870 [Phycisphaerales bacterium]|nr:hypothetical protein [Phycisphaerales bacterium]